MLKSSSNKKIIQTIIFIIVILSFIETQTKTARAEVFDCSKYLKNSVVSSTDCDQKIGAEKKKCEEYDKKARSYCDLVEIKSKTQSTLKNQLSMIDAQQEKTKAELKKTQEKEDDIKDKIESLEKDIEQTKKLIQHQQVILSSLIQTYYEYNQEGVLQIVLLKNNFSDFFNQSEHLEQASGQLKDILQEINEAKSKLEGQYQLITDKKKESQKLQDDLEEKAETLQYSEQQKKTLLTQTQGEEQKYRDLLARVEQQKMELFDFGSASNSDELSASVSSYPKPPSKYSASEWYFSQKDSRWAGQAIGNSQSSMRDWGCAVTSVAMVFKKNGASIDPGRLAKQPIFSADLIKWPDKWSSNIKLTSGTSHSGVNWKTVDAEIAKGNPIIVYIRKTNRKGGHYVVIHHYDFNKKDYVVNDPYFGANLYLSTSKTLVGKLGVNSGVVLDQMIIYKK